jgi:hypothetical protein
MAAERNCNCYVVNALHVLGSFIPIHDGCILFPGKLQVNAPGVLIAKRANRGRRRPAGSQQRSAIPASCFTCANVACMRRR